MSAVGETVFYQWMTGILLFASICWAVFFAVLAFRDRPRYKRGRR